MSRLVRALTVAASAVVLLVGLGVPAVVQAATTPPSITTSSLPGGIQGKTYKSTVLTVKGGTWPYTWSVVGGELPPGVTLTSGGQVKGTVKNKPFGLPSSFDVTIQVSDAKHVVAQRSYTIDITRLSILTDSLKDGRRSQLYSASFKAVGGCGGKSLIWGTSKVGAPNPNSGDLSVLPTGVRMLSNGVLLGTPKYSGTYTFEVWAECPGIAVFSGSTRKTFTLTVS